MAAREAAALPRGQALRARAVMYLALLAGGVLAALRVLPSPMYLASALADPALPQVRCPHSIYSNKSKFGTLGCASNSGGLTMSNDWENCVF